MAEFWALVKAHDEKESRAFIRAGTIAAMIIEVHRDPKKRFEPFTYRDIFPHLAPPLPPPRETSWEEVDQFFRAMVDREKSSKFEVGGGEPRTSNVEPRTSNRSAKRD